MRRVRAARSTSPANIDVLTDGLEAFREELLAQKHTLEPPEFWYPYDTLSSVWVMSQLLEGPHRDLATLAGGDPIADIGAADGDLAFYLETFGLSVDIVDNGPTNFNGLRGARRLQRARRSRVTITEADLDSQFGLPRRRYGLVLFLGILYHLKNPFYALEQLALRSRYAVVSTRIARTTTDGRVPLAEAPVAYLVAPDETNNDPTNFWIFSEPGLQRILSRTGWDVVSLLHFGDVENSNPSSAEHDERAFCFLRSRNFNDA